MPQYPECAHILTSGRICGSPAIKGSRFCYFHTRDRQRQRNLQQARQVKLSRFHEPAREEELNAEILESLQLPLLEDGASIQVALTSVLRAIAGNHIRSRRSAQLLYGLQIAVSNLRNVDILLEEDNELLAPEDHEPIPDLDPLARSAPGLPSEEEQEEQKGFASQVSSESLTANG